MDPDPGTHPGEPLALRIISRMLVAAAALVCCYILYRLVRGYYDRGRATRRHAPRRPFGGRKDFLYTHLSDGDAYEDEGDSYRDSDISTGAELLSSTTSKPLPDKPLPPLPDTD